MGYIFFLTLKKTCIVLLILGWAFEKKQTGLLVEELFFVFVQVKKGVFYKNESPQRMQNFPFQKTVLSMFSEVFLGGGCRV